VGSKRRGGRRAPGGHASRGVSPAAPGWRCGPTSGRPGEGCSSPDLLARRPRRRGCVSREEFPRALGRSGIAPIKGGGARPGVISGVRAPNLLADETLFAARGCRSCGRRNIALAGRGAFDKSAAGNIGLRGDPATIAKTGRAYGQVSCIRAVRGRDVVRGPHGPLALHHGRWGGRVVVAGRQLEGRAAADDYADSWAARKGGRRTAATRLCTTSRPVQQVAAVERFGRTIKAGGGTGLPRALQARAWRSWRRGQGGAGLGNGLGPARRRRPADCSAGTGRARRSGSRSGGRRRGRLSGEARSAADRAAGEHATCWTR